MTFKIANKLQENFVLDENFNIVLKGTKSKIEDPLHKGYIYANLYFYDELQKELEKLRDVVRKIHDEVAMEFGQVEKDPMKLLSQISTRVRNVVGEDSLDAMVKELLAENTKHLALMVDKAEAEKLAQISEAIFMELTTAFFDMTIQNARDLADGVKTFRFSKEYVDKMTDRQKRLIAPALKMIGLENQIKLSNFDLSQDWTVKYTPEYIPIPFLKQEETIKDALKNFIHKNS